MGWLEREWKEALGVETQLVRLTQRTAQKQRKKHGGLTLAEYRQALPAALRSAQVVVRESGHWGRAGEDLVFFRFERGKIYKAAVSAEGTRRVRLATFYETDPGDIELALARGKVLRDRR